MNAPERFELFTLAAGEKKISYQKDTKIQNAGSFIVQREDHTLGNILRMQLHRDKDVHFAGYKVPHPLEHCFILKIQTTPNSAPLKAFESAIADLQSEVSVLEERFKAELNRKRGTMDHSAYM